MFEALRAMAQPFTGIKTSYQSSRSLTLPKKLRSRPRQQPIDLDYAQVCNVVLITQINPIGQEVPVALAFVNNDSEVTLLSLYELSEPE